jgi:signal transduction protein with GAF and PtsI domain
VVGVLVMQRRRIETFSPAEIALATALGAPIVLAIESARRRLADRQRGRSARLTGVPVIGGTAMGRVSVIPTLVGLPDPADAVGGGPFDPSAAVERLGVDLERATRRLKSSTDPEIKRALDNFGLALMDQRFRDRISAGSGGLVSTLRGVAKEYARVPYRVPVRDGAIEPALEERSREIEDLCVLLYAAATRAPLLPPGGVWLGERVGAFVALCAVARGAAAIVCDGVAPDGPGMAIARAGGVPVLTQVEGLYAWVRPGDLVVVDADAGVLRVNPAASSVESFRKNRDG